MERIFVEIGSSVNILFNKTIDQMKVERFGFDPISNALFGFTGHVLQHWDRLYPLSLGNGLRRVTKMTYFNIVESPSLYNGILGDVSRLSFEL